MFVVPFERKCSYIFVQFFMKHLYVLMSWPEDMDMLWIKFLSIVSFFCSANLTCLMIDHIFKGKHKVAGDIQSLNLLVCLHSCGTHIITRCSSFHHIIRLSPLRQGLLEPDFYGDLVYKLKKIVGSNNFSAHFIKIISHYKKIGYNINVLQQTACLVANPITVGNFAFLFNCTPVGRTSDSMMVPT